MLVEVLLARETLARTTLAILKGTHVACLGPTVLLVDFALVAQEAARVSEALDLVAARLLADIGTVVLVHVFTRIAC